MPVFYVKKMWLLWLEPGFPVLGKAFLAVNRSTFGWFKGYFAFFSTVRADGLCHLTAAKISIITH
ncbi:MAG: Uncharacterized protein XE11_2005 [Methanomicrobiales archaeon 53_19]|nr:MAG: Uncharacterized protein XE11_2005 [Methanomicrobiales archaeon 53_19]